MLMSSLRYFRLKPPGFGSTVWLARYRSFASMEGILIALGWLVRSLLYLILGTHLLHGQYRRVGRVEVAHQRNVRAVIPHLCYFIGAALSVIPHVKVHHAHTCTFSDSHLRPFSVHFRVGFVFALV